MVLNATTQILSLLAISEKETWAPGCWLVIIVAVDGASDEPEWNSLSQKDTPNLCSLPPRMQDVLSWAGAGRKGKEELNSKGFQAGSELLEQNW